jgi:Spy/CpxP family protein refolding chaperone
MQTKLPFLILSCLVLSLSLPATAQVLDPNPPEDPDWNVNKIIVNRIIQKALEEDASGLFMAMLVEAGGDGFPGLMKDFGITDEQRKRLSERMEAAKPEWFDEIEENVLDPMEKKALKDENYVLTKEEGAVLDGLVTAIFDAANSATAEVLTAEQIQQMDGMLLALTGSLESPFFNERHMAALEMTEEQKGKFKEIDESMKPGRDKMVDECVTKVGEMLKSGKFEFSKLTAVLATFKNYSRELKKRRMAVLTDAQIAKAARLGKMPKSLSMVNLLPQWTPGPDSWRPGMPIPGQERQEQNKRGNFPRPQVENEN